jgi:DNA-binding MarR family transcriptional regulator
MCRSPAQLYAGYLRCVEEAAVARERKATLIALFRQTSRLMVDELVDRMHRAGYTDCTAAHHTVFEAIDPDGTRLTVLAERTGMTHQSMSELVATMERLGYVTRVIDPSDGRARLIQLTQLGRQQVRRAIREIAAIERAWTQLWDHAGFSGDLHGILDRALTAKTRSPAAQSEDGLTHTTV